MLKGLNDKNEQIQIYSVNDERFKKYGRVIDIDATEICKECKKLEYPKSGSQYIASIDALEKLDESVKLGEICFGGCKTQIGITHGYSNMMNGLEYHKCSEVNVAVTPMVLILGDVRDIDENNRYNSKNAEAFYLEAGDVVEIYSTTLHFCPCQVSDDGFSSVVVLAKETNTELEVKTHDRLLFKKNKWIICHEDKQDLIDRGVFPGIYGINYEIKY